MENSTVRQHCTTMEREPQAGSSTSPLSTAMVLRFRVSSLKLTDIICSPLVHPKKCSPSCSFPTHPASAVSFKCCCVGLSSDSCWKSDVPPRSEIVDSSGNQKSTVTLPSWTQKVGPDLTFKLHGQSLQLQELPTWRCSHWLVGSHKH